MADAVLLLLHDQTTISDDDADPAQTGMTRI
jgi:hypothetical protein